MTLNNQLTSFGSGQLSKSGFYTSGGAGFIYIGFMPNLRIGGMGFGGGTSESAFVKWIPERGNIQHRWWRFNG